MTELIRWRLMLLAVLAALFFAAIILLPTTYTFRDDTAGYMDTMHVLSSGVMPAHFVPNRILTTSLGLASLLALSPLVGGLLPAWYAINSVCFFLIGFVSFELFRRLSKDTIAGFFATLVLMANYAMLVFGLTFLMDIGSWLFYVFSLYFLYRYAEAGSRRDLIYAALIAGIGGLWKEYSLVACLPIACVLIWENRKSFTGLVRNSWVPAIVAVLPALIVHLGVYFIFHYTYLDWYRTNTASYSFSAVDVIKGFGVVLSLSAFSALGGLVLFTRQLRVRTYTSTDAFLIALLLPPILFCAWPGLTERVMFLAVPTAAAYSALLFARFRRPVLLTAFVLVYIAISLATDSYILTHVTLPL